VLLLSLSFTLFWPLCGLDFGVKYTHFVRLQEAIHDLLRNVFVEANRGIDERSRAKHQDEQTKRAVALQDLVNAQLKGNYTVAETESVQLPLLIDPEQNKVLVSRTSHLSPRSKSKREIARLVAIAFEISMTVPESERRQTFYKLLSQILDL